jgi:adenosyl cobinamide kinase/adenosyl cobinamide phosphate guanylyltransferase
VIALVLGGARSGKSEVAERLCGSGAVTYVATYVPTGPATDPDMAARIAAHRARRPAGWATVEAGAGEVVGAVAGAGPGAVLLDSLTTWVAGADGFDVDVGGLCAALAGRRGDAVVVSDEVGMGVHPSTEAGRLFRDRLGEVNQQVAAVADRVLLVVAGRTLTLDPLGG